MKRALAPFLAALVLGLALAPGAAAPQGDQGKPTLTPYALMIQRKYEAKDFPPAYQFGEHTSVEFLVRVPGKVLLRVDSESRLTAFSDDRGASLTDAKDPVPAAFHGRAVTLDRTGMLIAVTSHYRVPSAGARKLVVRGSLVLACGRDEKATPETKVDFQAAGDTKVGDLTLRFDPDKGNPKQPYFELIGAARAVKQLTVIDDGGKEVPVHAITGSDFGPGPRTFRFRLSRPIASGKVTVAYYAAEDRVTVPVDLTFGVGL
jgi:hypothetical protein